MTRLLGCARAALNKHLMTMTMGQVTARYATATRAVCLCLFIIASWAGGVVQAQNVVFNPSVQATFNFSADGVATSVSNFQIEDSTGITTGPVAFELIYSASPITIQSSESYTVFATQAFPFGNCSYANFSAAQATCTISNWSVSGSPPLDGAYYVGIFLLEGNPPGGCVTGITVSSGDFAGYCVDSALQALSTETVTYTQDLTNTVTNAVGGGGCTVGGTSGFDPALPLLLLTAAVALRLHRRQ